MINYISNISMMRNFKIFTRDYPITITTNEAPTSENGHVSLAEPSNNVQDQTVNTYSSTCSTSTSNSDQEYTKELCNKIFQSASHAVQLDYQEQYVEALDAYRQTIALMELVLVELPTRDLGLRDQFLCKFFGE